MALNPKQEKFCLLYHESGNAMQSYIEAYGCAKQVASDNAWRVTGYDGIKARLDELRGEASAIASLSREEIVERLVRCIETPIGDVDENSVLCEEMTIVRRRAGDIIEEVEKIKMMSKAGAIKELNRMCGHYAPEKHEITAEAEMMAMLKGITGAKES